MGIFSSIIIGLFGGLVYIYFVKHTIKQNISNTIDDNTILRSLSMVQLHILYIFMIYGYVHDIDPMAGDREINALLNETFIGDIIGFFSDINTEPNYQAIAIVEQMQDSANVFLIVGLGLCIIESLGLIGKKIDRWTIELISIICSITSFLYLKKVLLFQEEVFAQSKLEGIANFFEQSFIGSVSWIEPVMNITFVVLIINHILYNRALNKYYGENKIKSPLHLAILVIFSLGGLYLFNRHFLNPDIIVKYQNDTYEEEIINDTNTSASSFLNNNEAQTVNHLSKIQSDPNKLVLYTNKNGNITYYVEKNSESSYKNVIYKYNSENNITEKIECENIKCTNGTEVTIYSSFNNIILEDGKIIMLGSNGANSLGHMINVIRFYPEFETFKYICSSHGDIETTENGFLLQQMVLVRFRGCMADSEYYCYNELYDFDGNKLDGYIIEGEGKIDNYPIKMFFHCYKGNITGWYKYAGHDNYMNIKGQLLKDNQFSFVEYDEKGEMFATFVGVADLKEKSLQGKFFHGNKQLNFWVHK